MQDKRFRRRKKERTKVITKPPMTISFQNSPEMVAWVNMMVEYMYKKHYNKSHCTMMLWDAFARNEGLPPMPGGPEVN